MNSHKARWFSTSWFLRWTGARMRRLKDQAFFWEEAPVPEAGLTKAENAGRANVEGQTRKELIEKFIPQSTGYVAARLPDSHQLPNGDEFDHLIVSRSLSFSGEMPRQSVSLFFSKGLTIEGLCEYEVHYELNKVGDVCWLKEIRVHHESGEDVGVPKYYVPEETEEWLLASVTAKSDGFLELLNSKCEFVQLPRTHPLLKVYRIEAAVPRSR